MEYFKTLKKHYGTEAAACKAIGLTPQAMTNFKRNGRVPIEWQIQWELHSNGAVRADLPDAVRNAPAGLAA